MRSKPRNNIGFQSPGPGAYDNGSNTMKGNSFASGKRFRLNSDINVIGPGAY